MPRKTCKTVFGLVANTTSAKALKVASQVIKVLRGNVIIEKTTATALHLDGLPLNHMNVDILITIGGDGTVLRALQQNEAKILGINAGVLGFLTEARSEEYLEALERATSGNYTVEERIKLATTLNGKRLFDCANEVVVHTAQVAKMVHFKLYIDRNLAMDVRADGIIIATPTGSTSYALSLGGPLIDPKVRAFVIVPKAPFKLSMRPIVVPAESVVHLKMSEGDKDCVLVLDGQHSIPFTCGDSVEFTLSEKQACFIRFGGDFYSRVEQKLRP